MAQPAEVAGAVTARTAADPLVEAYAKAWARVEQMQRDLVDTPELARQRTRLAELQRSIGRDLRDLDKEAGGWVRKELPGVYATGAELASTGEFTWTQFHRGAVQRLADGLYPDLLRATKHVDDSTKKLVRAVGRDRALGAALEGKTAVQTGREMRRVLERNSVYAVTYANGARHGLAGYTQMALRTVTATAYNEGTLNGPYAEGVTKWEVYDGPNCGWSTHQDADRANGKIVSRDEALAHSVSHPNCRRAFAARPDLGKVSPSKTDTRRATDVGQVTVTPPAPAARRPRLRLVGKRKKKR